MKKFITLCAVLLCNQLYAVGGEKHYQAAEKIRQPYRMEDNRPICLPTPYQHFYLLHVAAEKGHEKAIKDLKYTAKLLDDSNSIWGGSEEANQNIRALLAQYSDYVDHTVEENAQIADEQYQIARKIVQEKHAAIYQEKNEHYAATGNHIYTEANFFHYYPAEYFLHLHQAAQAGHKQAAYALKYNAEAIEASWVENKIFGGSEEANQNIRALLAQYR